MNYTHLATGNHGQSVCVRGPEASDFDILLGCGSNPFSVNYNTRPRLFLVCNTTHWGDNCKNICECGPGSSNCDRVHGCVCGSGWSGGTCFEDVNECLVSNACGDINKVCRNTFGSFDCSCRVGFTYGADNICEGKKIQ